VRLLHLSVLLLGVSAPLVSGGWAAPVKHPAASQKKPAKHGAAPAPAHGRVGAGRKAVATAHGKASKAAPRGKASGRNDAHARTTRIVSEPTPVSRSLTSAFVASSTLRPMAQQLASSRSAAAFAGVENYAGAHPGEGAAAAYLAMGHSYAADRRYGDAVTAYRSAANQGSALRDYAEYLGAQAALNNKDVNTVVTLLTNFGQKYPGSIFVPSAPVTLANAYLVNNDPANALRALAILMGQPKSQSADYLLTEAKAHQASGDNAAAAGIYRQIYVRLPFSPEAVQAKAALQAMNAGPSAGERKLHADAFFNAKRYADAADEYSYIEHNDNTLSQADRDALEIYAAVCDLRLKHLSRHDAERLPDTGDDSAALKLYILAEISRTEGDQAGHASILQQMEQRFPHSRWLEEALYSGGNMYLIKRDSAQAISHYTKLFQLFPNSTYAPSAHWRSAWLNYRMRNYAEAARLMEEQVQQYPSSQEAPNALYWRARMYEEPERNFSQAANFYTALSTTYRNYYYANLARQRLAQMGTQTPVDPAPALASVRQPAAPTLIAALPENDPHLIKARLLANAALNEYIAPEIQASGTSGQWGSLAEAEIYTSYGENVRALQAIKRSGSGLYTLPVSEVPTEYWQLLFPRPYWSDLTASAQAQGLDPYLVASLIRQESEFNPGAISRANAMGLMQLLPAVGKAEAKKMGMRGFSAGSLLNPSVNLRLGTANLRQVLDRYNGTPEYALAAYNAGDVPIRNWMAENNYKDIAEFVESIPYTETREYVQSILRNREMYRQLYH
jgi:soluble lytic murein transglycosylase